MRRPSFQFYPADWRNNANLRRCSWEARGVWVEVMGLMHDSDQYGVLLWPLKEIAQALGAPVKPVRELADKGVMKGADSGSCESLIYVPRSGRKDGEPVILIAAQPGPIWYSSRMVKDEYVRTNAGAATRFQAKGPTDDSAPQKSERAKLRAKVLEKTGGICYHCNCQLVGEWEIDHLVPRSKGGRHTLANMVPSCVQCNQDKSDTMPYDWAALMSSPSRRQGDGSTSSSSSSPTGNSVPNGTGGTPPKVEMSPDEIMFGYGVPLLVRSGNEEKHARSFLGKLRKLHGDGPVIDALRDCIRLNPSQPLEWLAKALPPEKAPPKVEWHETQSGIEAMGVKLGVGAWDESAWKAGGFMPADSFMSYKARVMAAHQQGAH